MLANKTQEQTDLENYQHCKSIADELIAVSNGDYKKCPHCGELVEVDEANGNYSCPQCDYETEDEDDFEPVSLWDYFQEIYDTEYRIGSDGEYRSVRLMVACGGPNIYIDTGSKAVELYWWTDRAQAYLTSAVCDEIDSIFEEYYAMMRT